MGQVLIRSVDDRVLERLRKQAAEKGISLEESLRRSLAELARPSREEVVAEQDRIRAMGPRIAKRPLSGDLIREDRDTR